jgi:hypothetical protein
LTCWLKDSVRRNLDETILFGRAFSSINGADAVAHDRRFLVLFFIGLFYGWKDILGEPSWRRDDTEDMLMSVGPSSEGNVLDGAIVNFSLSILLSLSLSLSSSLALKLATNFVLDRAGWLYFSRLRMKDPMCS